MKIRSNGKVYRSTSEWQEILADYRASGVKMSEYCIRHGIATQSLSKAERRYGASEPDTRSFVELLPIDSRKSEPSSVGYRVELDLGCSMVLRIR
ncbi:IS66 family insertion sequence element accessory protein TnpA [Candidatus Contendibacter odensensis]|uniref:IS66 family insertion sequence element accessory protein TnpA n=1 Tax=Candidatus Contendibacter odensensis TaxID=1400860 RepID=UPI00054F485E